MFVVKVATVTTHASRDTIEDALNVAATFMRTSEDAVAIVVDGENHEAEVVLHNNFAYLAKEESGGS
jgi:hypothetical protein